MAIGKLAPWSRVAAVGLAVLVAAGCQSRPPLTTYSRLDASGGAAPLTPDAYRSLEAALRPGDIILGAKHDPTSLLMRLAMDEYGYYTHPGIVDVRGGDVVVSHAMGRFKLFHNSPRLLGKVVGSIEAVDLETFIREYHEIRIVRLPDEARNRQLAELARACERRGLAFDPFFDTNDPDSVHCSEYAARALTSVGYDGHVDLARRTPNESMSELMRKVGIMTEWFVRVDGFAEGPGTRTVAVLGRFDRPELSVATVEAFRALHDRVTGDPALRVGDLVSCNAQRLIHFAPTTDAFLRAAMGLAQASPTSDPGEARRRNAILLDIVGEPVANTEIVQGTEDRDR